MIDVNGLFNLFPNSKDEEKSGEISTNIKITPQYWLGMHKKLILNHINFKKRAINFFSKSELELDIEDVQKAGEFVAYNKAWSYITMIDMNDEYHIDCVVRFGDEVLETSLELAIKYFQELEEYEKCAHLLKILKKSKG
tara:strand:- start:396 stop:812 length:417 start_codon:yes stop_codon:yes gene_type:complete